MTPENLVTSFMGPNLGRHSNWKMIELSNLQIKLCAINQSRRPAQALYLYWDPTYSTIYKIIGPYKNYSNWP